MRLKAAGVTRDQVQVAWIKHALARPIRYGEFPGHVKALEDALATIVRKAQRNYPHLQIVFVSSRIYGGYATSGLNPEPFAYESAFAVRDLNRAANQAGAVKRRCSTRCDRGPRAVVGTVSVGGRSDAAPRRRSSLAA